MSMDKLELQRRLESEDKKVKLYDELYTLFTGEEEPEVDVVYDLIYERLGVR